MKAFSLIELMVVIAIVAILAAIAVPAYGDYMKKSRLAVFLPTVNSLLTQALDFGMAHDHFPNAYELGLSNVPNSTQATSGASVSTYFQDFYAFNQGLLTNSGQTCNASTIVGILNMTKLGFPANTAGVLACYVYPYNHTYISDCYYTIQDTNTGLYDYGDYIPNWARCQDSTCSYIPYYTVKDGGAGHIGVANATCDAQ
jgi:prepilin-type N-terminal cleavage/methylation domain-containing protein